MSTKLFTTILLAAGLAASKPIAKAQNIHPFAPRQEASAQTDICVKSGSSLVSALTALQSKAEGTTVQINANNLIVINMDNSGRNDDRARDGEVGDGQDKSGSSADAETDATQQRLIIQQANQALLIDQQVNAANNEIDNVLRAMAATQKEPDKSTVILVVQEIKINIEVEVQSDENEGEKGQIDTTVYKQEIVVANRGKQETETVMVYATPVLNATDAVASTKASVTGVAHATTPAKTPTTKTVDAVLYNARPTYTVIAEDPASSMRAALKAAVEGRGKDDNATRDIELSIEIAVNIQVEIEKNNRNGNNKYDYEDEEAEDEDRQREHQQDREQKQSRQQIKEQKQNEAKEHPEEQHEFQANQDAGQKNHNKQQATAEKAERKGDTGGERQDKEDVRDTAEQQQDGLKPVVGQ